MAEYGPSDIDREAYPVMYDPQNAQPLTAVVSKNSASITIVGDGTAKSPLYPFVAISKASKNALTLNLDGLFVGAAATIAEDSTTIEFFGEGTEVAPLSANVKVSSVAENNIEEKDDGLYVPTPVIPDVPVKGIEEGDGIDVTEGSSDIFTISAKVSQEAGNLLSFDANGGLFVGSVLPSGGTLGQILTKTADGYAWASGISTASAFVQATGSTPLTLQGNDVVTTANVNITNTADGYFSVSADKTASGYSSTLSLGTGGFAVSSSRITQTSSGPLSISSASTAAIHSDGPMTIDTASPMTIKTTSGAPISIQTGTSGSYAYTKVQSASAETRAIGDSTHYAHTTYGPNEITNEVVGASSPTLLTISGNDTAGTSSISGGAKSISFIAAVGAGDTGTATFNAGAVGGTTTISGSSISLIAAPYGSLSIGSAGISIVNPAMPFTLSTETANLICVAVDGSGNTSQSVLAMTPGSLTHRTTYVTGSSADPQESRLSEVFTTPGGVTIATQTATGTHTRHSVYMNDSGEIALTAIPAISQNGSALVLNGLYDSQNSQYSSTLSLGGTAELSSIASVYISAGSSSSYTAVGNMTIASSQGNLTASSLGTMSLSSTGGVVNVSSVGPTMVQSSQAGFIVSAYTDLSITARNSHCQIYTDSAEVIHIKTSDDALSSKYIDLVAEQPYGDPDQYGNRAVYRSYVQIVDTYGVYINTNKGQVSISNSDNNLYSYINITNQGSSNIKIYGQNGLTIGALNDFCKTYYGWNDTLIEGGYVNVKSKNNQLVLDGYNTTTIYSRNDAIVLNASTGIQLLPGTNSYVYASTSSGDSSSAAGMVGSSFNLSSSAVSIQAVHLANMGTSSAEQSAMVFSAAYGGISLISQNPIGTDVASLTYYADGSISLVGYPSNYDSTKTYELLGRRTDNGAVDRIALSNVLSYIGAYDSAHRPQTASTGSYILDTDLGYPLYRIGGAWVNATGAIIEGNITPPLTPPISWMVNPMTAAGDLIVGGVDGEPTRLPVGSQGQFLSIGASGFEWATVQSGGMVNPMTAVGDLIVGGTDGTPTRLPIGSQGGILKIGSNGMAWAADGWDDYPLTTAGDLLIAGANGAPTRLPIGSQGSILKIGSNGISWGEDGWDDYPLTAKGDILIGGTDGAPSRLALGTEGQQLFAGSSGLPVWQDAPKTGVQTYPIAMSSAAYPALDYTDRMFVAKVVASHDGKYTALGFGLKSGSTGKVGLAVYDLSHNLVARTELFSASTPPSGHVYWHDTEAPFNLVAGNEYFFAIWFGNDPYSNLLQVLGYKNENTFDSSLVGLVLGQQGITEMPSSFSTLNYEQVMFHICAK